MCSGMTQHLSGRNELSTTLVGGVVLKWPHLGGFTVIELSDRALAILPESARMEHRRSGNVPKNLFDPVMSSDSG